MTVSYGGKTTTFSVIVAGPKFAVEYQGNFSTGTPSNTRVTLITNQITVMHGQTLTLQALNGYKVYPLYQYGCGSDKSSNMTAKQANAIYVYAKRLDNDYEYQKTDITIGYQSDHARLVYQGTVGWSVDGGAKIASITSSEISGIAFDGIGFYVEKTDGSNITPSEAGSAVSWTIE